MTLAKFGKVSGFNWSLNRELQILCGDDEAERVTNLKFSSGGKFSERSEAGRSQADYFARYAELADRAYKTLESDGTPGLLLGHHRASNYSMLELFSRDAGGALGTASVDGRRFAVVNGFTGGVAVFDQSKLLFEAKSTDSTGIVSMRFWGDHLLVLRSDGLVDVWDSKKPSLVGKVRGDLIVE